MVAVAKLELATQGVAELNTRGVTHRGFFAPLRMTAMGGTFGEGLRTQIRAGTPGWRE